MTNASLPSRWRVLRYSRLEQKWVWASLKPTLLPLTVQVITLDPALDTRLSRIELYDTTKRFTLWIVFNHNSPNIKIATDDTIIMDVMLYLWDSEGNAPINVGNLFSILGMPDTLGITWGNHIASPNFRFSNYQLEATLDYADNYDVDNPMLLIGSLTMYAQLPDNNTLTWKGFNRYNRDRLLETVLP